jgi:pyruvate dehydrogenase E1 component beta subunit
VNNAATLLHMSVGQCTGGHTHWCGIGRQLAAQHSHSWEPLRPCSRINCSFCRYTWCPNMLHFKVQTLWFCSSILSYWIWKRNSRPGHYHRSQSKKRRKDISIITYGAAVYKCLEAANELAKIGIEAEVVDLRVLRPMDEATLASVSKHIGQLLWKKPGVPSVFLLKYRLE